MEMHSVESSCLKSVGYDADSQTLRLEFHSGATHDYTNVPPEAHAGLMGAGSLGKHFHRAIRNQFESRRIG